MIQWSLTLTGNQVAILKALEPRRYGERSEYHNHGLSHWITGIRPLLREGLIEHFETKLPNNPNINDQTRSGQFLTERGRFILRMIEQDIAKFLDAKDLPTKKRTPKVAKREPSSRDLDWRDLLCEMEDYISFARRAQERHWRLHCLEEAHRLLGEAVERAR